MPNVYQLESGPVVRGKASVCQWDLDVSFLDKEQCRKFIDAMMQSKFHFTIEYYVEVGDSLVLDKHNVSIRDGCWASNLTEIAKMLEAVDFSSGDDSHE